MKTKNMSCVECGKPRRIGRRICVDCNKQRLLRIARSKPRYVWSRVCRICQDDFKAWRKTQLLCSSCHKFVLQIASEKRATNNYVTEKGVAEHRAIAESIIGRKLLPNEVVHHIDEDSRNNSPKNLLVMEREDHSKLHLFLSYVKASFLYYNCDDVYERLVLKFTENWVVRHKKQAVFLYTRRLKVYGFESRSGHQ